MPDRDPADDRAPDEAPQDDAPQGERSDAHPEPQGERSDAHPEPQGERSDPRPEPDSERSDPRPEPDSERSDPHPEPQRERSDPHPEPDSERIAVGRINSTWGLKGHVKVTPFTSNEERLVTGANLIVGGKRCVALEVVSPQGYPIIRFAGYNSRTAAERLRDELIEVDAADLPPLPEHEYYVDDLRGLTVVTTDGTEVGTLADVLTTGANDVYLVQRPGQKDVLIPATAEVVLSVDLETRRMTIDPLPGLLDV